eukprot:TRINITY_DN126_c0_g1_i1.p1 TRINITY_DN126_c0_g1~~TRINITY_DN126_c0_g1_i1.p1  ORF type:complete len:383 (-),score=82.68 TRINITY_DN126_c0_g1_i1:43-1191(-)
MLLPAMRASTSLLGPSRVALSFLCRANASTISPPPPPDSATQELISELLQGNRNVLAKSITLVESTLPGHKLQAQTVISSILSQIKHLGDDEKSIETGNPLHRKTFRLGISGSPGVGKSTFIESLGVHLCDQGHKVAVLAIDPSSIVTKGSILGDKSRMKNLTIHPNAYIRPSPSTGQLGGVARATSEAIILCEAAGYDVVIVETVGVGQSEVAVKQLTDMFAVLLAPAGGDELQGIKKGILELADVVVINKSDGDLVQFAKRAEGQVSNALHLAQAREDKWVTRVMRCSSRDNEGISDVWKTVVEYWDHMRAEGRFIRKRQKQIEQHVWSLINSIIINKLEQDPKMATLIREATESARKEVISPGWAAESIVSQFLKHSSD